MSQKNEASPNFIEKIKDALFEKKVYQPPAESAIRYDVDSDFGLTSAQVKKRTQEGYVNNSVDNTSKSVLKIVLSNIFTYFNMIFIILAILLIANGSFEHLTFLVVVFFNTVIGIIQELKAKKTQC